MFERSTILLAWRGIKMESMQPSQSQGLHMLSSGNYNVLDVFWMANFESNAASCTPVVKLSA